MDTTTDGQNESDDDRFPGNAGPRVAVARTPLLLEGSTASRGNSAEEEGHDSIAKEASLDMDEEMDCELTESPFETPSRDAASAALETAASSKDRSAVPVTLELLSKGGYYDMPMAKAAHLLGRTEGSFQRVCRALGILRWPYRVRKSLQAIMVKTEQYLDDSCDQDGMSKAEVMKVLEAHMEDIKGISGNGMDKATKQYRQYIFKLNHKLAKKVEKQGQPAAEPGVKFKGMLRAASKISKSRHASKQSGNKQPGEPDSTAQAAGAIEMLDTAHNGAGTDEARTNSSTDSPGPMRPKARHFRDLPSSLAFQPLGHVQRGSGSSEIVGQMATSAAIQSRLRGSGAAEYQKTCLQNDQELLRLCIEMDAHLHAAHEALKLQGPLPGQAPPLASPDMYVQHILSASLGLRPPLRFLQPATHNGGMPEAWRWPC